MPDPFATVADLEARWRPLTAEEQARAEVLLADASAILRATCPTIDQRITDGTLDPELPEMVTCNMVRRSMGSADVGDGVSTQQQSAGPFSTSLTFANPQGNLYASKAELKLLGCGARARAYTIDTTPAGTTSPTSEDQLVDVIRTRPNDPALLAELAAAGHLEASVGLVEVPLEPSSAPPAPEPPEAT